MAAAGRGGTVRAWEINFVAAWMFAARACTRLRLTSLRELKVRASRALRGLRYRADYHGGGTRSNERAGRKGDVGRDGGRGHEGQGEES